MAALHDRNPSSRRSSQRETARRQSRYRRRESPGQLALTSLRLTLLRKIAEYGLISSHQLAKLVCPSVKSAQRHCRELFDAGLIDIVAVPRACLLAIETEVHPGLAYGSSPNVYSPTREGIRCLFDSGFLEDTPAVRRYGAQNWSFLAHELAIRDVRVWLELCCHERSDREIEMWVDGGEAEIDLRRANPPRVVRPDAWFVVRFGDRRLVGLVEVDRGTERLTRNGRWQNKLQAYGALYERDILRSVTGYQNARVLTVASSPERREALSRFISASDRDLASRFWLVSRAELDDPKLSANVWERPCASGLHVLVQT